MTARRNPFPAVRPRRQRGVVLFVALIVMIALSLAAIALVRSVDTTTAVVGNLAFREASIMPATMGIESAAAALFSDAAPGGAVKVTDRFNDLPSENYLATYDPAKDDKRGIPEQLQKKSGYPGTFRAPLTDAAGNEIRYVIQRMCRAPGPVDGKEMMKYCDMMPPKVSPGTTINDSGSPSLPPIPFYRVTVRVDGPAGTNAVSFVQAVLR